MESDEPQYDLNVQMDTINISQSNLFKSMTFSKK